MKGIAKRAATILLALAVIFTLTPFIGAAQTASAETVSKHFTIDDFEFYESDVTDSYNSTYDGGVGVSSYTGTDTDVTVPRAVYYEGDYYCVTVIGEAAFKETDVTSVVIPDSVRYIEQLAFSECPNLKDLYVNGKNVTCHDHSIGWAYDVQEDVYTRETNPVTIHGFQGTGLHTYAAANEFAWEDIHVITSVELNGITRPVTGEKPTKEGITAPHNSGYSFYPAASGWYNESNGNWQGNNAFESGKEYSLNAWILPEPGYVFADDLQSIEVERPEYVSRVTRSRGGVGVTYLVVIYEYYPTQGPSTDIPISEINITYDTDAVSHSSGKTEGETYDLLYAEGGIQVAADQGTASSGRAFLYENNNNGHRYSVEGSTDLMTPENRYDIYVDSIKLGSGYCFPDSVKAHTGAFTVIGSPADFNFKVNGSVREDVEIKYQSGVLYAWIPIGKSIEDATVTGISDITYTGAEVSVSPTVIVDGIELTNGPRADYTVLYYGDRKNVGSVRAELVGHGNYYGRVNREFNILPADLASVTVPTIPEQKYSGKALTPSFTPTYNGIELIKDVDYTAVYSNNVNVGTATVTITGKGNFTGTVTKTFQIKTAPKGWVKEDGFWYFYDNDGNMVKNAWKKDSKGWCYLGSDGRMVTNDWAKDSKGWCWIGPDGYMVEQTKWIKVDGGWYHITKGYRDQSKWMKDSKGWCYLGSDGRMVTNGWAKDSVGWCWMGADGYWVANKWIKDNGEWYYIKPNHYMAANEWAKDSGGWMWMNASGKITKSKWIKDGGYWYYLKDNGYMATGTVTIDGKTYTFDSSGRWIE